MWLGKNSIGRAVSAAFVASVVLASGALAQSSLADRVGSVLGDERSALATGAHGQLATLASASIADLGDVTVAQPTFSYDSAFISAQPTPTGGAQWECLTEALYFEARGETVRGMFAVAEVIMNRVDRASFPNTVCGVVNQGTGGRYQCQFTYTCDGIADRVSEPAAWRFVGVVARTMLDGAPRVLTDGATHYHTRAVSPAWARVFLRTASIGSHYFYRS